MRSPLSTLSDSSEETNSWQVDGNNLFFPPDTKFKEPASFREMEIGEGRGHILGKIPDMLV